MERLREAAAAMGAVCLDDQWLGARALYQFKCAEGHEWHSQWTRNRLEGCDQCFRNTPNRRQQSRKKGLELLQKVAVQQGGFCESGSYLGTHARYGFRCAQGHRWQAKGGNVLRGTWCRACKGIDNRLPDGLERLQSAAAAKGGLCLSTQYTGMKAKHEFKCANSHVWLALGKTVMKGGWCLQCSGPSSFRVETNGDNRWWS